MRIALVTCRTLPDLAPGDRLLQDELRRRGAAVVAAVWDDDEVDWGGFQTIVIRSPWDYHLSPHRFASWLDRIETTGRLINPPDVIRWNVHKRYLLELEQRGCAIPRTRLVPSATAVVVKPAISGGAYGTVRLDGDLLVQDFVPEIATRGEWSLMFFDGAYSHAVLKRVAGGDFRVQAEWGGSVELAEPPAAVAEAARRVVSMLPPLPFARIDLVESADGVLLMEAELIEPELFLDRYPAAAARFADVILK